MASNAGKWIGYGCLGCVGVLVLCVLFAVGLFAVARSQVGEEQVREQTLTHEIPALETEPVSLESTDRTAEIEIPDSSAPGRIVLDLSSAEFFVDPAEPGDPLEVEARYDETSYELTESFVEKDGEWEYRLSFRQVRSGLMSFLRSLVGASQPRLRIRLPRSAPVDLEVEISQGGAEIELGELWLRSAAIEMSQGGGMISFSDPLREPMESLRIDASMGGFMIERVGNASPREARFNMSMGGGQIDLRGDWLNDSEIEISATMGGAAVQLPRDVSVEGAPGGSAGPDDSEVPRPTLRFDVSGEVEFQ